MTPATVHSRGSVALPRGGRLAFRVCGPDPARALLLIRPLGGTMALWEPVLQALDPQLRAIVFDAAGTGASQPARACASVPALAADALQLLDHLNVARADLLGQSLGSFVALHFAATHPQRVGKLLLVSTALRGASFARLPLRAGLSSARCMFAPRGEVEVCLLQHMLSERFRRECPSAVRTIELALRSRPTQRLVLLSHLLAAARYDGTRDAARMRGPVRLVAGADDRLLGTAPQAAFARALGAQLTSLPGVGHDVALEAPARLGALVNEFLCPKC